MSRFYGTIDGAGRSQATRRGHSSLVTHAAGWQGAIRVELGESNGADTYKVSLVPWKQSGGTARELCEGTLDASQAAVTPEFDGKAYQRSLCESIVARLNAQQIRGKVTRTKHAIDMLCGAASALHLAQSPYYNGVSILAVMVSARGVEVVENVAATGEL